MSMKDVIKERLKDNPNNEERLNMLRECLQALILKFIEEKGYSKNLAFVGGTCLRFIHGLQRFSEGMDFSILSQGGFDFETAVAQFGGYFESINIAVESKARTYRNVKSMLLKFPEIMFENDLTHRKDQKLLIRLEVDTNPPLGSVTEVSFIQKFLPMSVTHFDMSSLFAGKLHAVLMREYAKGRDFYDFMWFVGRKTVPNYPLLSNAVFQSTGQRVYLDADKLKEMLKKRIEDVDWNKAAEEVGIFLVNKDEKKYLAKDIFTKLVENSVF